VAVSTIYSRGLGMKVLVTGGAGYVGSHAVRELLAAEHDVVVYDNLSTGHPDLIPGVPLILGDIAEYDRLREGLEGVDAVMHFAASAYVGESMRNPRKYFCNNVESALRLLDAVLVSDVRVFVFSSTCATYGVPERLPVLESFRKEPINPYGATKLFFEQVLAAYEYSHGLKHVCLRYFNAAGADPSGEIGEYHDPETHLIPLALKAILGTGPELTVFGKDLPTADGTCIRDFIHVSDLGRAHVKALEYLTRGGRSISLNLGTGQGTSIGALITALKQVTGRQVPHQFAGERPGDPPALYADPSLAKDVLGWTPTFDLKAILETAWQWEVNGLCRLVRSSAPRLSALYR
jgi:UDP-glucose-4-epimerase GalE